MPPTACARGCVPAVGNAGNGGVVSDGVHVTGGGVGVGNPCCP